MGLSPLQPVAVGGQPPPEHPGGLALLPRDEPDDLFVQPRRHDIRFDVGDEPVLVGLQDLRFDAAAHADSSVARGAKVIAYSHALQPLVMWVRRSTAAPSPSRRNCCSAAHTSGKRSATARIAQLCSASRNAPAASCHSAMYPCSFIRRSTRATLSDADRPSPWARTRRSRSR